MSHEIRTPISTVVGFAELFVEDHDTEDEDNFISEIKKNAKYLLKLVNEILFLSRLDAHMIEFKKSPIDFAFTFEGHCQIGWAKLMKENVNYVVENPYEHLTVDIDDSKLGYVIEQVTENAARFTDSGSIRARYDYIGDKLLITIEDTGIGIEKERQLHIFDRFNIISNNQGTGLGMPICNELVQQMGGSIYINSAASKGTTVWVVIPCKAILVEKKLRTD
jgi:signal transduction histidine kinase